MSTYLAHYVLTDHEVPMYVRLLENWAAIAKDQSKDVVDRLIKNAYDGEGALSTKVEVRIRIEMILPLWDVMADELKRMHAIQEADRKLPYAERDQTICAQVDLLENVIDKLRVAEMSSTYSGIARDK